MNKHINTSQLGGGTTWERPIRAPELTSNRTQEDVDLWWQLVDRVIEVATHYRWTKSEVARRLNMPGSTFSQWFSGNLGQGRLDNSNAIVQRWIELVEQNAAFAATIPQSPPYMRLRGSIEVMETLAWAQLCPDLVMITLGAGMTKTTSCEHFAKTNPHVFLATLTESTKTVHGMLTELASELDVQEHNPARLARAIGGRLKRTGAGTLLIVDEGQHANDEAINQLRHFVDVYRCGVAIVGNEEVYRRFSKSKQGPSYAQLKSRVGKRLQRAKPYIEDLQAYIAAWGIEDEGCVKFLTGVGMKGGAFRQIDKTMRMATMLAMAAGDAVALPHIQAAWKNRDVEDIA
ncbi:DNA transposition protein [Metarhizobium album]|uniref:DNA transposition protein n=1 Tax=Metarhizobium album TaxID=2182425 RepID=A0A2U2DFH9_9HYPH|nr:AAA family ATPase [Rhizobium album]PWE52052.1 DNA transposition protein [Rhizobium album]